MSTLPLETLRSLLTELDCHTVFSTSVLATEDNIDAGDDFAAAGDKGGDKDSLDVKKLSEGLPMVEDALNCLNTYTLQGGEGGGKGQMAKAMRKLALASSIRRGEECAGKILKAWGAAVGGANGDGKEAVAERRKRERVHLEDLLTADHAGESAKKARQAAKEMTDNVMSGGGVDEEVFSVFYAKLKSAKEYYSKEGSGSGGGFAAVLQDGANGFEDINDVQEMVDAMSGKR